MEPPIVTRIKKFGVYSLGIIIPSEYALIAKIEEGDIVNVTIEKSEVQP